MKRYVVVHSPGNDDWLLSHTGPKYDLFFTNWPGNVKVFESFAEAWDTLRLFRLSAETDAGIRWCRPFIQEAEGAK